MGDMSNPLSDEYENLNSEIVNLANCENKIEEVKNILYPYLKKIINLSEDKKFHIFREWKHGNSLELTIKNHSNNKQLNTAVPWEESFCMSFLLFIYH